MAGMTDANLLINMQYYGYNCAMCGVWSVDGYAVPWYEEPVPEGQSEGAYRCVCRACYDEWDAEQKV